MRSTQTFVIGLAALATSAGMSSPAAAVAIFNADVTATLKIVGLSAPGSTQVQGNFNTFMMDAQKQEFVGGVGSATALGGVNVMVGGNPQTLDINGSPLGSGSVPPGAAMFLNDALVQSASASGSSVQGLSIAGFFSTGVMSMENFDVYAGLLDGFTVDFELIYSYSGTASVTDTGLEQAAANIKIALVSGAGDVFTPIEDSTTADGDGGFAGSGTVSFTVPDFFGFEQLNLVVDAFGSAEGVADVVAVPEPGILAAFGAGLFGLIGVRRRRKLL